MLRFPLAMVLAGMAGFLSLCYEIVLYFFFFYATATTEIYTLSLHDALPICEYKIGVLESLTEPLTFESKHHLENKRPDRKSTRLNSSHVAISYAVFCLK